MGLLELVERRPAFPRDILKRGLRSRGIEHLDRLVGPRRPECPLRLDQLVGLFPDIHQLEPALAVAVERRLDSVIGAARPTLHRREEVGIGVGEHAVAFLLGVEQVGEGDDLALELGQLLPRFARPARMPRPLDRQRPEHPQPSQRSGSQGERPRAKHPIGLPARHLAVAAFLDPRLGGIHQRYEAGIDAAILGLRPERLADQLLLDRARVETAAGLQAPRGVHRHPVLVDIDVDEDILRGIKGRPRGPGGNLPPPAGEDRVEDVARRAVPVGPLADDEHAVVAPRLALDPIDRGPEVVERIGHPRHEDMLGGIGGDTIDDSGGRLLRQRPASARHDRNDGTVAGQDRPRQHQTDRQSHPPRLKPARRPATGSETESLN